MTDTLTRSAPLQLVFPLAPDRAAWQLVEQTVAADTGKVVHHYRHRVTAGSLRLDESAP